MNELPPLDCGGCTKCCRGAHARILLVEGEDQRRWRVVREPKTGYATLHRRPNGDCHYVTPTGCRTHKVRPKMCQAFDCRVYYLRLKSGELPGGVWAGGDVAAEGEARLQALAPGRELVLARPTG